jgi:hypothetical protein
LVRQLHLRESSVTEPAALNFLGVLLERHGKVTHRVSFAT